MLADGEAEVCVVDTVGAELDNGNVAIELRLDGGTYCDVATDELAMEVRIDVGGDEDDAGEVFSGTTLLIVVCMLDELDEDTTETGPAIRSAESDLPLYTKLPAIDFG